VDVTVKLGAALAAFRPPHETHNTFTLELDSDSTVANVLSALSIPAEQSVMLIVNDELVAPEARTGHVLKANDRVSVLTPIHAG